MSIKSIIVRLAALLAVGLVQLGPAATASAADDVVCAHWRTDFRSYIDEDGNDWTEITYRCDFWLTSGEHGTTTPDHGDQIPDGPGANHDPDVDRGAYCNALGNDIVQTRRALAVATGGIDAARQRAEDHNYNAGRDYADYVAARDRAAQAQRDYDDALAVYLTMHDTEIDIETRNGNTTSRSVPIEIATPEGKALAQAEADLRAARAAEKSAFERWGSKSAPEAAAAQAEYARLQAVVNDSPAVLEQLQREQAELCKP